MLALSGPASGSRRAQVDEQSEPVRTARLVLVEPASSDVDEVFAMYAEPLVTRDDALLRHASPDVTERALARYLARWRSDGLAPWVMRLGHGPNAGRLVGLGGCSLPSGIAWNLSFTLRPEFWGLGYAQEVAAAGIRCARALRPDLPITAVAAAGNRRSQRALERAGLQEVWRGRDAKSTDPSAVLLLHSDRALSPEQVQRLTT
jgi:RimJ/RimL family protein N-acetyltransferase